MGNSYHAQPSTLCMVRNKFPSLDNVFLLSPIVLILEKSCSHPISLPVFPMALHYFPLIFLIGPSVDTLDATLSIDSDHVSLGAGVQLEDKDSIEKKNTLYLIRLYNFTQYLLRYSKDYVKLALRYRKEDQSSSGVVGYVDSNFVGTVTRECHSQGMSSHYLETPSLVGCARRLPLG